jgi:hypothetical protein
MARPGAGSTTGRVCAPLLADDCSRGDVCSSIVAQRADRAG